MKMARAEAPSLRHYLAHGPAKRVFSDRIASVNVTGLNSATSLDRAPADLAGRSVLIATASQLAAALAMIELDGYARRLTVLPPDTEAKHLGTILADADIDSIVVDEGTPQLADFNVPIRVTCRSTLIPNDEVRPVHSHSEWLLLTSGTTGRPKLVAHTLADLTAPIATPSPADGAAVWATFYDIRRYGGLQIFLRAALGGASLVLSDAGEPVGYHLSRLAQYAVTHLSGTPSHWRRALISPAIRTIAPRYVRLSGEIADQTILDALRFAFPQASIGHAYASTEAGVAFDVNDGLAGFPVHYIGGARDGVELKVENGSLRVRSSRTASRYIGSEQSLADQDGFVDTGDVIERRGDRYYFVGRKDGVINIGGMKVHPEEIEAVINRHPTVRLSLVRPRKNPITGSIVVADVVLKAEHEQASASQRIGISDDILRLCRSALPPHKVPAAIKFVPSLVLAATGKLARDYV
jgi:acyl-coenzyme A synthetase/AMP-(fatty) acid ligase